MQKYPLRKSIPTKMPPPINNMLYLLEKIKENARKNRVWIQQPRITENFASFRSCDCSTNVCSLSLSLSLSLSFASTCAQ
jgi:hypothetical protein